MVKLLSSPRRVSPVDRVTNRHLKRFAKRSIDQMLKDVIAVAERATKLEQELESKVAELRPLGLAHNGFLLAGMLEDVFFGLRKGHFKDTATRAETFRRNKAFAKAP